MNNLPMFITSIELANLYRVSLRTVEGWRRRKVGPTPLHLPNMKGIRYEREEVLRFIGLYRPEERLEGK